MIKNIIDVQMTFPFLSQYADYGLLFMRIAVALVFGVSGWNDLKDPAGRAKSMGVSGRFTVFLGLAEIAGALGLAFGVLTQLAALGLIVVSLGAAQKKIFVWKTGFWGDKSYGWHYDLLFLAMNAVIMFTNGGKFIVF